MGQEAESEAPDLVLIAAVARNGVIGQDNGLPFRLKSDMQHFKRQTTGTPVVMGRKTWESIGRALPKRLNIVVSRQSKPADVPEHVVWLGSLDEAVTKAKEQAQADGAHAVHIIGGGDIYAQCIMKADKLVITHVDMDASGDAQFPPISDNDWRIFDAYDQEAGPEDDANMRFVTYVRRNDQP